MNDKIEVKKKENPFDLENLRKLIDTKTREEIAQALGCDTSLITKHYNNQRVVQVEYLIKYAAYFNVSVDYLLGRTTYKNALDTDEGELIRSIGDYTGLNEEAIEVLHNFNKPMKMLEIFAEKQGYYEDKKDFQKRRQEDLLPINTLLASHDFFISVKMVNDSIKSINYIYNDIDDISNEIDVWSDEQVFVQLSNWSHSLLNGSKLAYYEAKDYMEKAIQKVFRLSKRRSDILEEFFKIPLSLMCDCDKTMHKNIFKYVVGMQSDYKKTNDIEFDEEVENAKERMKIILAELSENDKNFKLNFEEGDN